MRVGMQRSLIMALPLDWNFVKQRGAPGRPHHPRARESSHPPRLAAPGSCHTRNFVPVMHGRLFEVQRPSPLPGIAPESAAPTVLRIAVAMAWLRPRTYLGTGNSTAT